MSIIDVVKVSKRFYLQPDRPRSFQELVVNAVRRERRLPTKEVLWALKDVSFSVEHGETLGIIGSNGSGKSTCLKLLTRIIEPTMGQVRVKGRVSALLELGAGFHPELTGRENVFLNGSLLGLSRREMARSFDDIVAFAELERFIDVPVKIYSSGMYVRLAFATAINVKPDILLVDEVLAVGDQSFQEKCLQRIDELRALGVTIVFVSHNLDTVKDLCQRALWLDQGILREEGAADTVVAHYLQHIRGIEETTDEIIQEPDQENKKSAGEEPVDLELVSCVGQRAEAGEENQEETDPAPEQEPVQPEPEAEGDWITRNRGRWGSREAEIIAIRFLDESGCPCQTLETNTPVTIVIEYEAHRRIEHPVFGIAIHRDDGLHISGSNTFLANVDIPQIEGRGEAHYHIAALPLLEGKYHLSVAIHTQDDIQDYDYRNLFYPFCVERGASTPHEGLVHIPARWEHLPDPETKRENTTE